MVYTVESTAEDLGGVELNHSRGRNVQASLSCGLNRNMTFIQQSHSDDDLTRNEPFEQTVTDTFLTDIFLIQIIQKY